MIQKIFFSLFFAGLLLIVSLSARAQNNVVIVPMAGDSVSPPLANLVEGLTSADNVVTVAEQGGDFTDPIAAMASITATAANRYLLFIAPGVFELGNQQLVMKEYVEIAGNGQNATILRGSVSNTEFDDGTAALVVGANNASIRDLAIENVNGESTYSFGMSNIVASPTVSDIRIIVSGSATFQAGVFNDAANNTISDSAIAISGGNQQYGVYNATFSVTKLSGSTITLTGGNDSNQAGVFNTSGAAIMVSDSFITASGGTTSFGVNNTLVNSPFCNIHNSTVSAETNSVASFSTNETYISNSILDGSVLGDTKCSSTFLDDGTALDGDCHP